jgi:TonB family protein
VNNAVTTDTAAPPFGVPAQKTADPSKDMLNPVAQTASKQNDQSLPDKPTIETSNLKPADVRPLSATQNAPLPQQTTSPAQRASGTTFGGITPRDFVPPRPIRQVLPDISLFPPVFLASSPHVEVTVKVDKNGHVTEAHAVTSRKKVKEALVGAALVAAKQWSFEPAKLGGQPVDSEHTIIFEFHAQQ